MNAKLKVKLLPALIGAALALSSIYSQAYDYKPERVLSTAPVFAKNGMVSSNHPIGTLVGLNILQQGGNAFDAAVATALALSAVDMAMCGPGGASFWLLWDAKKGKLHSLDANTQAPAAATPDKFKDRSELLSGVKAIGIPGNMKAYTEVLDKFGTMKFADVVKPTLRYLEEGFVLTQRQSNNYKRNAAQAPVLYPNLARVFAPSGEWGDPGTLIKNPELATTYRTIAKEGAVNPTMMQSHVCAAKAGINMLTKCLAMEWGPEGVRVNAVTPGPIADTEGMRRLGSTPEIEKRIKASVPLRDYGTKRDIADVALFLCTDNAKYITGAIIDCDGGSGLGDSSARLG